VKIYVLFSAPYDMGGACLSHDVGPAFMTRAEAEAEATSRMKTTKPQIEWSVWETDLAFEDVL